MSLTTTDIPFARDDANRFLPWMIGLMSCIAALMLCVGMTLGSWVQGGGSSASHTFTVQVPDQGDQQDAVVADVLSRIQKTKGVATARVLSNDEVRSMLAPWIGEGNLLQSIALPSVIEARSSAVQDNNSAVDFKQLRKDLASVPGVEVDAREIWAEKFASFSRMLQSFVYVFALCIILALGGMMVFTARAAMKLHDTTVQLLHAIGADDHYIARQFQYNTLLLAMRGALPGTGLAAALYLALGIYARSLDAPLLPAFSISGRHGAMLLVLPLACALVAVMATRYATLKQLKLLP